MKNAKRLLAMCLAVIMMCSVPVWADHAFPTELYPGSSTYYGTIEAGIYGTPTKPLAYPITSRMIEHIKNGMNDAATGTIDPDYIGFIYSYDKWYDSVYCKFSNKTEALAKRWFVNYVLGDPEVWCEEYLSVYEGFLANHRTIVSPLDSDKLQYRVSNYEWQKTDEEITLNLTCEADYKLRYESYWANSWQSRITVKLSEEDQVRIHCAIALTDKKTGKLVNLGRVKASTFLLVTSYRIPNYITPGTYGVNSPSIYGKKTPEEIDGQILEGTLSQNFSVTMPDIYDPQKHDIQVIFRDMRDYGYSENTSDGSEFSNPHNIPYPTPETIPGDVDGDGALSTTDISHFARKLSTGETLGMEADITGDGVVNVTDLATMRRILSGGKL